MCGKMTEPRHPSLPSPPPPPPSSSLALPKNMFGVFFSVFFLCPEVVYWGGVYPSLCVFSIYFCILDTPPLVFFVFFFCTHHCKWTDTERRWCTGVVVAFASAEAAGEGPGRGGRGRGTWGVAQLTYQSPGTHPCSGFWELSQDCMQKTCKHNGCSLLEFCDGDSGLRATVGHESQKTASEAFFEDPWGCCIIICF